MGTEHRRLVLKFITEAEKVPILGGGCAETNSIRSEMNMLSNAIVDI